MKAGQPNNRDDGLLSNLRYRRKWKKVTSVLSIFVAVGTISSLMLPAITLNKDACGKEAHTHAAECYSVTTEQVLNCNYDTLGIHRHSSDCQDEDGNTRCSQVDFVVHTHDSTCYQSDGSLSCFLKEIEEYCHEDSCYQATEVVIDPGHSHGDDCYEWVKSETPTCETEESSGHQHGDSCYATGTELLCTETEHPGHSHSDICYERIDTLICTQEEVLEHSHCDKCFDENGTLLCGHEESSGHTHGTDCFAQTSQLVCLTKEVSGHTHSSECYAAAGSLLCTTEETPGHQHNEECYGLVKGNLICNEEEREPVIEAGEPELICKEPEVILHTHKGTCYEYDDQGSPVSLICDMPEVTSHSHTDTCFAEKEVQTLVCEIPEHTHTEACSGSSDLTEEEQAQVDGLILVIGSLPSPEEVTAQLAAFDETGDTAGRDAYTAALLEQITPVFGQYGALTEKQKSAVTNAADLMALEWLMPEEETLPALTEEEQVQVDALIALIDSLPTLEELAAQPATLEMDEEITPLDKLAAQAATARDTYNSLSPVQQAAVTNEPKLAALEAQLAAQSTGPTVAELLEAQAIYTEIVELPTAEEAQSQFDAMASDEESLAAYQAKLVSQVQGLIARYDPLHKEAKADVSNIQKLLDLIAWLKDLDLLPKDRNQAVNYTDGTYTQISQDPVTITLIGNLPEGAEVRSFPVEFSMGDDAPVLCARDITIYLEDGSVYQPDSAVTVEFSGLELHSGMELDVFHVLEDEYGGMERMAYTVNGDTVTIQASSFSTYAIIDAYHNNRLAEPGDPEAVQALIDSGFFTYWSNATANQGIATAAYMDDGISAYAAGDDEPSDSQITVEGGSENDGTVTVSKTINGTDVENVFDITLTVDSTTNIVELQQEPDMAVVIVMDISNTMNGAFGSSTRYAAAIKAAEDFLDKFATANKGYSRIGYVAFNTDANEIFGLSECSTTEQATALKNTMRSKTGSIISAAGYGDSHKRFTNIEAGLKMGYDMLKDAPNDNKYIIFLSDGFPTTYIKSGYTGYDPYTSSGTKGADGVFYDYITGYYCSYGTSYSDKAAIRARQQATKIKDAGTKIFSIGIDVGGQTISGYDGRSGLSVIDRTSSTYELGSATDTNAFKNWLGNSIGSGYYYDSTNTAGLQAAYDQIFAKIKSLTEEANALKWIASDPIPNELEFIGFYNNKGQLQVYEPTTNLIGSSTIGGENMISYVEENKSIAWNLKLSGYTITGADPSTTYHYKVTYRVRLRNELDSFVEYKSYNTNGTTSLTYQNVTIVDGNETISDDKTVYFPIPAVKGYLGELTFKKVGQMLDDTAPKSELAGAEFELTHDSTKCSVCRGDGSSTVAAVAKKTWAATSGENGLVTFSGLPSGHRYVLKETKAPAGYQLSNASYSVIIAYDKITVERIGEESQPWDFTDGNIPEVINYAGAVLPATGGAGTLSYTFSGWAVMMVACALMYNTTRKKRKGAR